MNEREPVDHSAEGLIISAANIFGIDLSARQRLVGFPEYALKGRVQGINSKYKAAFEHSPFGDMLTAYAYPAELTEARNRLTTIFLNTHPLRADEARFTNMVSGQTPELLEGIAAQDRIAKFLEEAQVDISQREA